MKNKYITYTFIITFLSAALLACGGGGGSDSSTPTPTNTPTDTSLVFATFPATYFNGNYSASYALSGSFTNGDNVTATLYTQSGSTTTFNSQTVTTINELVTITNTSTNAVSSTFTETYYSTDINSLMVLGSYRTIDGVTSMNTSTNVLPLTAKIGDFGVVGAFTLSDGTSTSVTWSLADGYNGKAKLVMTTTIKDTSNNLYATSIISWTIAQDGTREALQVTVTYHQSGNLTLNMSGIKS